MLQIMKMKERAMLMLVLCVVLVLSITFYLSLDILPFRNSHNSEVKNRRNPVKDKKFTIAQHFVFPQPTFSRPAKALLRSMWVAQLQIYLNSITGNEISLVTSSVEHTDILLNWLIAAFVKIKDPLKNVLVLSMDKKLHSALITRGISSLFVHKDMVIHPKAKITRVFSQVHIVRLAVLRLINHYGYDVVNYDCDAILLKNPQPIFDQYNTMDLIGTFGKGPYSLYKEWGVTLNTGVMLMRATLSMEYFWQQMPHTRNSPITDDQNSINFCLQHMRLEWTNYNSSEEIEHHNQNIIGRAPTMIDSRPFLHVMLVPYTTVCRHVCDVEKKNDYYVWHALAIKTNRTVAIKKSQAMLGGAWYLRDDWKRASDENLGLRGTEWLRYIAN